MMRPAYIIHTADEIRRIRIAAHAAATVREKLALEAQPGMSTKELDMIAGAMIRELGGTPTFLGYHGFPANICISLNDEVVHGIARPDRIMMKGDVVSLDIGVTIEGGVGDTAKSFCLGEPQPSQALAGLLEGTRLALDAGIRAAKPDGCVQDISRAVEKVAREYSLGIVRDFVGHGCGTQLHEPPEVPNFASHSRGPKLLPGMVLCIEPMLNMGTHKVFVERDNWTVRTADGKMSAHFEHMILITETQSEVLTSV